MRKVSIQEGNVNQNSGISVVFPEIRLIFQKFETTFSGGIGPFFLKRPISQVQASAFLV